MSYMEIYKKNMRKYKLYISGFIVVWVPALVINMMPDYSNVIVLPLMLSGIVFLLLADSKSRCPRCGNSPGWGWRIKKCKVCGERLSPEALGEKV